MNITVPSEYTVQCDVVTASTIHRYWWKAVQNIVKERPETAKAYSPQELYNYYHELLDGMGEFYEVRLMFNGSPVGMAVVFPEQDPHHGVCMSCMFAYADPEHRGYPWVIPALKELALSSGVRTISWAHRMSSNKYITYYRRVHE